MEKTKYISQAGRYEGVVEQPQSWLAKSKDKGTPSIRLPIRVINDPEEEGALIYWDGWLTDNAFERTIETLVAAFGFDGDLNGLEAGSQTLAGMPCQIEVEMEEYNGKSRAKVKWLNPPGYEYVAPVLPVEDKQAILATFNKRAMQTAKAMKKETPKAATPAAASDDDIPF